MKPIQRVAPQLSILLGGYLEAPRLLAASAHDASALAFQRLKSEASP